MIGLILREIKLAARIGGGIWQALSFFLVFVLISALGLGRDAALAGDAARGILWVGVLLATLITLDRLFQADFEDGTLEALALGPFPLPALVIAKIIGHWLTTGLPLVVISPLMGGMLGLPLTGSAMIALWLGAGSLSASAIGAIGAAATMSLRRGGALLGLLVMPLFVPTLIFGIAASQPDPSTAPLMLIGILGLSIVLAPMAASAIIRLSLR